jgi:hypothetical protein
MRVRHGIRLTQRHGPRIHISVVWIGGRHHRSGDTTHPTVADLWSANHEKEEANTLMQSSHISVRSPTGKDHCRRLGNGKCVCHTPHTGKHAILHTQTHTHRFMQHYSPLIHPHSCRYPKCPKYLIGAMYTSQSQLYRIESVSYYKQTSL